MLLLWASISAAFTAMVIQYSLLYGKLAAYPFYDDLGYLVSGLSMLRTFYQSGFPGLIRVIRKYPPHTFFSIFEAFFAFLIFGRHDWAPYAANGVIILALAIFLNYFARGLPLWQRILLLLFVLTVPICEKAVYEFRPDIPSALCTAIGATLLVSRPLTGSNWRHRWGAGSLFGLAMFIKTPTFPLTLAMLGMALVAASIADALIAGARPNSKQLFSEWGSCVMAAFAVALPAYLSQIRDIIQYIIDPIFGKSKELWRTHGNWMVQVRFYLDGDGGREMLGRHLYLIAAILLAGAGVAVALRRRQLTVRIGAFMSVALIAYLVPTLMPVKQAFFGTSFDWMLVFAALYLLILLCRKAPRIAAGVVPILLLIGLYIARFIAPLYLPEADNLVARRRVIDQIYDSLAREHVVRGQPIYITTTGYVNLDVFNYLRLRRGLSTLTFGEAPYHDDLKMHAELLRAADFVIASEQGNSEAFGGFVLSGNIQDQTLAMVRADPNFEQIAKIPTGNEKCYFVFRRNVFHGWRAVSGLSDPEGPYPQWNLGKVRWGLGPRTVLTAEEASAGVYELIIEAKPAMTGEEMIVRLDGIEVSRHTFADDRQFDRLELPEKLSAGRHQLEFDYSTWQKSNRPMAVLFRVLELARKPDSSTSATGPTQSRRQ